MPQRILVVGTSFGGGNWPPLAAVTIGLFNAGHEVQCFGDRLIAHDFASAASSIEVVQAEATLERDEVRFGHIQRSRSSLRTRPVRRCRGWDRWHCRRPRWFALRPCAANA